MRWSWRIPGPPPSHQNGYEFLPPTPPPLYRLLFLVARCFLPRIPSSHSRSKKYIQNDRLMRRRRARRTIIIRQQHTICLSLTLVDCIFISKHQGAAGFWFHLLARSHPENTITRSCTPNNGIRTQTWMHDVVLSVMFRAGWPDP